MLRPVAQQVDLTFTENGPFGLTAIDQDGPNPWTGAISAVVPHPTNPDVMWIGAVNGGVWKTTNATNIKPTWIPLTDHEASLSIGALARDALNPNVLVAGIGATSSAGKFSGPLTGLLRTTDGGNHWHPRGQDDLTGQSINGVVVSGSLIIVSSKTGIWRSVDSGATFTQLGRNTRMPDCIDPANIVKKPVTALAADPVRLNAIYAAIPGSAGGVFASDDSGCSWNDISMGGTFGQTSGQDLVSNATSIVLSVHDNNGTDQALYVAIKGQNQKLAGVFRSADGGATWTAVDMPPVTSKGNFFAIRADPTSPFIVYLGAESRTFFRCNASFPRFLQCASIAGPGGTLDGSEPHEDSRSMAFDAAGNLLETDDGGLFKRVLPRLSIGLWRSLNGNLSITETHSCAWDHIGHVAICGTQDNGSIVQRSSGAAVWKEISPGDGGTAAVREVLGFSVRYYSSQGLASFSRDVCIATVCTTQKPTLLIGGLPLKLFDPTIAGRVPIAAHALNPSRLVIATGRVYESDDAGDTLTLLDGLTGTATRAVAFGSTGLRNILYVGSSDGLFRHTAKFGAMHRLESYTFGKPIDIAIDPANWQRAWVINDDPPRILYTETGGMPRSGQETWIDVTGNLLPGAGGAGATDLHTITFASGSSGGVIFVGASDGLYAMSATQAGIWSKLHGALPNAIVNDLDYDETDDILLITTHGRGTWILPHPATIMLPAL